MLKALLTPMQIKHVSIEQVKCEQTQANPADTDENKRVLGR